MARPGFHTILQSDSADATGSVLVMIRTVILGVVLGAALGVAAAFAEPLGFQAPMARPDAVFEPMMRTPAGLDEFAGGDALPAHLRRQVVSYLAREPAGTLVIDTPHTYLYFVIGDGRAIRYGIGVGREGFAWSGVKYVDHKSEWPDWFPPPEMIERQPYLPRFMAGGVGNPLGARAIYLGGTLFRIHGTNAPATIGHRVSSGCIRMLNEDVIDLYARVGIGARVVVLPPAPVPSAQKTGSYRAPAAVAGALRAFAIY